MRTFIGAVKPKKSWKSVISPFIKKYDEKSAKVFKDFEEEKSAKNITKIADQNRLWKSKYEPILNRILDQSDKEYEKIWNKYHKK